VITALPPQTATRGELVAQLSAKQLERDECASRVRSEPEARKDLKQLNAEVAALEEEITDSDAAERANDRQRKAAAIAEDARRREMAAQSARAALGEVDRWGALVQNAALSVAEAVSEFRAAEARTRQAGSAAIRSAEDRDAFQMSCTPLLTEQEIADLLAEASKGRFRNDLAFASKVRARVKEALTELSRRAE
jgi:hypothetical protein